MGDTMTSLGMLGRYGLIAAGAAVALSAGFSANAEPPQVPGDPGGTSPAPTAGASYAPTNPVNCADPNNTINCNSAPIDSPLVVGTAAPGSPFRD